MTWQVDLLESDFTVVATGLSELLQAGFFVQRARDGLGSGTVAVANDHTSMSDFTPGRVLRWTVNGVQRVTVLESRSYMRLGEAHSDEVTLLDGPGGLALLGESGDGIKGGVVQGLQSSGARPFGWVAPDWDDSSWTPSVSLGSYANPTGLPGVDPRERPPDFPCDTAEYISLDQPTSDGEGGVVHPPGAERWFRQQFDFSDYSRIRLYFMGDNRVRVYSNGEHAFYEDRGTLKITSWEVDNPGDEYTLAAWHENLLGITRNPMMLLWAIYSVSDDGEDEFLIARSAAGNGVFTDTEPDGVTAGYVLSRLIDEAQARGALSGISYTFTDTADSSDTPVAWSESLTLVSYRDGEAYWPVLQQVLDQFSVDARMGADGELLLHDSAGSDVGVDLTDGTVALTADAEQGLPAANAVRVSTGAGVVWRTDAARIDAEGRREDAVSFGTAATVAEVETAVDSLFDKSKGGYRQTVATVGPDGAAPFTDYDVGYTVGVRVVDGGTYLDHTVEAIDVTLNVANDDEVDFDVDVERLV